MKSGHDHGSLSHFTNTSLGFIAVTDDKELPARNEDQIERLWPILLTSERAIKDPDIKSETDKMP